MLKAIVIIRSSTVRQEVESQRKEIVEFALTFGYLESELMIIGESGASAIKLDEAYIRNLNLIEETINNTPSIESVFAWAIDRIGRNEEVLMRFKNFLISRKINLVIKEPSLSLLNKDGSVNNGVELAFSLFATMSKQEMEMKQARFKRAKARNAEINKYNGGVLKLGYTLDENNFVIPDPNDDTVTTVFNEFSTGKYSCKTLSEELNKRGYQLSGKKIHFILKDTAYTGETEIWKKGKIVSKRKFIPLVSKELFDKCQSILRDNNTSQSKSSKTLHFGNMLIKCPICGRHFVASTKCYRCSNPDCNSNIYLDVKRIDSFLWSYTEKIHKIKLQSDISKAIEDIKKDNNVLAKKIKVSWEKYQKIDEKKTRVQDGYVEGIYSKEQRDDRFSKIDLEKKKYLEEFNSYKDKVDANMRLADSLINNRVIDTSDLSNRYNLIHTYIKDITPTLTVYNNYKAVKLEITTAKDEIETYFYLTHKKKGDKFIEEKKRVAP